MSDILVSVLGGIVGALAVGAVRIWRAEREFAEANRRFRERHP